MPKVGRRPAHIVNIALKARQLGNNFSLAQNGIMAARLNNPPLVRMNGAKGTAAKATATADNAKLHLLQGRYTTLSIVARVPLPHIRQVINCIHFLLCQGIHRGILDDIFVLTTLNHRLAVEGVLLPTL